MGPKSSGPSDLAFSILPEDRMNFDGNENQALIKEARLGAITDYCGTLGKSVEASQER